MVKLVDTQAWGVCGQRVHSGSSPDNGTFHLVTFLFHKSKAIHKNRVFVNVKQDQKHCFLKNNKERIAELIFFINKKERGSQKQSYSQKQSFCDSEKKKN